jgi:hypothetical protein
MPYLQVMCGMFFEDLHSNLPCITSLQLGEIVVSVFHHEVIKSFVNFERMSNLIARW